MYESFLDKKKVLLVLIMAAYPFPFIPVYFMEFDQTLVVETFRLYLIHRLMLWDWCLWVFTTVLLKRFFGKICKKWHFFLLILKNIINDSPLLVFKPILLGYWFMILNDKKPILSSYYPWVKLHTGKKLKS